MKLQTGEYAVQFRNGGILIEKTGKVCTSTGGRYGYRSRHTAPSMCSGISPMIPLKKKGNAVTGLGRFETDNGSVLRFRDLWSLEDGRMKIDRRANVEKAGEDDLGFQTRIFFYQEASDKLQDYEYFAPGQWYLDNRYAASYAMGNGRFLLHGFKSQYAVPHSFFGSALQ